MTPAIALGFLFVLLGAQVTRVLSPQRGSYAWLLLASATGVAAAELLANAAHIGGPAVGVLHPVADAFGIALAETAGLAAARRRRVAP
ncbi:MAG: hypothetical protein ABR498_05865 [Candidatus Dormibacteria bacterium]